MRPWSSSTSWWSKFRERTTLWRSLSRWAYPAGKGMTDVPADGDEAETAEAKEIIDMERMMEENGVKCFVIMAVDASLGRRVSRAV